MATLFTPTSIGAVPLSHRIVMAPLTRLRAEPDDTASEMMAEHSTQRATEGGLIIVESASISKAARGYYGAPGLYEDRHIEGYRRIAEGVHGKGGRVFAQIAHNGRTGHLELSDGVPPVGPSLVPLDAQALTPTGWKPVSPHRAMTKKDIESVVDEFRQAARRAFEAGVDGIEIHAANGYLIDAFLQDGTNKRTDEYGGPVANRVRFLAEIIDAVGSLRGSDRVGVRLAPSGEWNDIHDSDPEATFGGIAELLNQYGLAYLHVIEPRIKGDDDKAGMENHPPVASALLRKHYHGRLIAAGGFTGDTAAAIVARGDADLVAFGRLFTSNPDLPERLRRQHPLTHYDRSTFWGGTEIGYTDFPAFADH
jgi:N-ethylmaleimide reductase